MKRVNVIGAGLAGCEAANVIANHGYNVKLFEMKPQKFTPAHSASGFAELVCSNSLKGIGLDTASGLLKAEMRLLGSLIIEAAEKTAVPAGGALAVDRNKFSEYITAKIKTNKNIKIITEEVSALPEDGLTIICTGPLTTGTLINEIVKLTSSKNLYFFDAAAPIIDGSTIDYEKTFIQARYDKGGADYVNCPLNKEEYKAFVDALISAERAPVSEEDVKVFESCMPVEIMASRNKDSLRFGPMKPVGLRDKDGIRPYAVAQLRKENTENSLFNIVGFQTNLKFPEQLRVFSMIPALRNVEIVKYGVMHRNSYINAPLIIDKYFRVKSRPDTFIAGQLSGVEGYEASAASGLLAGINAVKTLQNEPLVELSRYSMLGSIINYITTPNSNFQPMNANFGIVPPLTENIKDKRDRKLAYSARSLNEFKNI